MDVLRTKERRDPIQTYPYRSPEIFYKAATVDQAIDMWSIGIVLCELLCLRFTVEEDNDESWLAVRWAKYLGKPPLCVSRGIGRVDRRVPTPWPANFVIDVGRAGMDLLVHLLKYEMGTRITAEAASRHAYFHPDHFPLMGYPATAAGECSEQVPVVLRPAEPGDVVEFTGARHNWVVRSGEMAPEVIKWIKDDPAFTMGTPENDIIQECFRRDRRRQDVSEIQKDKDGEEVKLVITAGLRSNIGKFMFKKKLHLPNPVARSSAFIEAFKNTNRDIFLAMEAAAVEPVRRFGYGPNALLNATDFLNKTLDQWLLPCNQLNFTKGVKDDDTLLQEPEHFDGGPSVLHLGLGLGGRRDVVCEQVGTAPNVALKNVSGTVYLGMFTGPKHQVIHRECPTEELVQATPFGRTSCTVMCRTSLFPAWGSRLMNGYVHTPELFKVFQGCFRRSLRQDSFRLPTLAECMDAEARLHLTLPSGVQPGKSMPHRRRSAKVKASSHSKVGKTMKTFRRTLRAAAAARAAEQHVASADAASDSTRLRRVRILSKRPPPEFFGVNAD